MGASIAEELLNAGSETATALLVKCLADGENKAESAETYRDTFLKMISDHYIIKIPELVPGDEQDEAVPKFQRNECDYFSLPTIDLKILAQIQKGEATVSKALDAAFVWSLNYDRFHQEFRDDIMKLAIERKLGENAAECFSFILNLVYNTTDPWQRVSFECIQIFQIRILHHLQKASNLITFVEIKQEIERKSNNLELIKYLDQYICLIGK